jgi:hypothetical protein
MSELKNIINEFNIKLSNDDMGGEDEMRRRNPEHQRDRGDIDFDGFDGEGEEGFGGPEGPENFDGGEDSGEFGGSEDSMGDDDPFGGEGPESDIDGEEEEFAGEKRVDITNKLKAMLQGRGEIGDGDDPSADEELPSLDSLDLDDAEGDIDDDDDDLDFDYDALNNKDPDSREDEDDEKEFSFSNFSR